jgi:hypothetical protein
MDGVFRLKILLCMIIACFDFSGCMPVAAVNNVCSFVVISFYSYFSLLSIIVLFYTGGADY